MVALRPGWLFTAARNIVIDRARAAGVRPRVSRAEHAARFRRATSGAGFDSATLSRPTRMGRDHYLRKRDVGKTSLAAMGCLKRRLSHVGGLTCNGLAGDGIDHDLGWGVGDASRRPGSNRRGLLGPRCARHGPPGQLAA